MDGGRGVQEVAEIAGSRLQILVISPKCKSALVPTENEMVRLQCSELGGAGVRRRVGAWGELEAAVEEGAASLRRRRRGQ